MIQGRLYISLGSRIQTLVGTNDGDRRLVQPFSEIQVTLQREDQATVQPADRQEHHQAKYYQQAFE